MVLTVSPDKVLIESPSVDGLGKEPRLNVVLIDHTKLRDEGRVELLFFDGSVPHKILAEHIQLSVINLVDPSNVESLSSRIGVIFCYLKLITIINKEMS